MIYSLNPIKYFDTTIIVLWNSILSIFLLNPLFNISATHNRSMLILRITPTLGRTLDIVWGSTPQILAEADGPDTSSTSPHSSGSRLSLSRGHSGGTPSLSLYLTTSPPRTPPSCGWPVTSHAWQIFVFILLRRWQRGWLCTGSLQLQHVGCRRDCCSQWACNRSSFPGGTESFLEIF